MDALDRLHTRRQSPGVMIVEVMGRTARLDRLHGGIAGGRIYSDSEIPFDFDKIAGAIKGARGSWYWVRS